MNNRITTTRLFTVGIPIAIATAILTGTLALGLSNNNNPNGNNNVIGSISNGAKAAGGNPCYPASLASIKLAPDFVVRQPTSLPKGYALQGVMDDQPTDVQLLYADHSLCNFPSGFDYQGNQLKIVVTQPGKPINGTDYQQRWLNVAADPNSGVVAKVQPVDVNGYKGAGWEQFDTNSVVRLNGTIIHSTPFHGQAALFFYNDKDQMTYSIFANSNQTLTELLDVARSIR